MNVVAVQRDGLWLALDAADVEEVLGERAFLPLPGAAAPLVGAMHWKGGAIAVVDVAVVIGRGSPLRADAPRHRNPVLRSGGSTFALPVDQAREAVEVADANLAEAPGERFVRARLTLDGQMMPLVDVAALVASLVVAPWPAQ